MSGWCNLYRTLPSKLRPADLNAEGFKGVATNQRCQVDSKGSWETKDKGEYSFEHIKLSVMNDVLMESSSTSLSR